MKQDGVLAPDLFNLFFTCMWLHIVQGLRERVYIRYQLYSSLFDLLCLKEQMKSLHTALQKTLFIDDSAQLALKDNDLQFMMNKFLYTAMLFGLSAWTRLKHFTSPDQTLTCRPNNLCWWHSCKHLQILRKHHDGSLDKETDSRISKISQTLRCLCIILLNQHNIHISAWNCCYLFSPKGMGVPDSVLMANQMEKFHSVFSVPSLTFVGKIVPPTWETWIMWSPLALSPWLSQLRCGGWAMSSEWPTLRASLVALWCAGDREETSKLAIQAPQRCCEECLCHCDI